MNARSGDRRKETQPVAVERRKVQRRRQIDPTTCERDYSDEEVEFMQALDAYKRRAGRMFPTCSEILEVLRDMGYVRMTPEQRSWLDQCPGEQPVASTDEAPVAAAEELVAG
ncbi:MAG TPA: hypothetical protein VGN57_01090 [Pirellulaceae bacterium]|nr:hypothetical protein [Pirellulaceae bacterium]